MRVAPTEWQRKQPWDAASSAPRPLAVQLPPPTPSPLPRVPPPPRPGRQRLEVLRGVGVGALFLVSVAVRIGLHLLLDGDAAERPTTTTVPSMYAGTVSSRTLTPGTCVDRIPMDVVRTVPCNDRHAAEIVGRFPHPAPPGAPYPPILDLSRLSLDRCKTEFTTYTGVPPEQAPARYYFTAPEKWDWDRGERAVLCYASGRNGVDLTTSVRAGAG